MKIICFGDSLTRGVTFMKGRVRIVKDNYPALLQKFFNVNKTEETETIIINKGVYNDNSQLLVERLNKDVLSEKPNYVLIGIGGNDCNFKWDEVAKHPELSHEPIVPIPEYINNIKNIIAQVKESNIKPILLTLPPLDPVRYYQFIASKYGHTIGHWVSSCGGIEHWHGLYNLQLKNLINQLNIPSIDIRSSFKKTGEITDYISDDGIHLTAIGYKEMSKIIYEELVLLTKPATQQ
ncbi:SGNH/GDSL hydrolase family protein [Niallia sp. 03133]|uniref:SGNH/GDSL hydrolase family protein n=1 Tax=Niallia sp. 03133 TaxID=3458060 RepID=UPI0040441EA6